MYEWNVRARPFELPADGKTVLGDWKMPLGWECPTATLEIIDPFELRRYVEEEFSPQRMVRDYVGAYQTAIERARAMA